MLIKVISGWFPMVPTLSRAGWMVIPCWQFLLEILINSRGYKRTAECLSLTMYKNCLRKESNNRNSHWPLQSAKATLSDLMGKVQSSNCRFCGLKEEPIHLLTNCRYTATRRRKTLGFWNTWAPIEFFAYLYWLGCCEFFEGELCFRFVAFNRPLSCSF